MMGVTWFLDMIGKWLVSTYLLLDMMTGQWSVSMSSKTTIGQWHVSI